MSNSNFYNGQAVKVTADHNHFTASAGITYHIGSIDRVQGQIMAQLLVNGKCVGVIPQDKLKGDK